MKNKLILFPLITLFFALISCEFGGVEYDPGIELTTCNSKCGEIDTCQTSRGDMIENQKVELSFRLFGVNKDGTRDFPEGLQTANVTLILTVEGEGSVKVSMKDANGQMISATATNGNPAEIITDVSLVMEQEEPSAISDQVQSANIEGITVETVDGPASGVQINLTVNGCVSNWCMKTHPICNSK